MVSANYQPISASRFRRSVHHSGTTSCRTPRQESRWHRPWSWLGLALHLRDTATRSRWREGQAWPQQEMCRWVVFRAVWQITVGRTMWRSTRAVSETNPNSPAAAAHQRADDSSV